MNGAFLLPYVADGVMIALALALLLTAYRVIVGPTLPDRIVALDLLIGIVIGFIATFSVKTGFYSYLDIAIALGLVGFLTTAAFARFVLRHAQTRERENGPPSPQQEASS